MANPFRNEIEITLGSTKYTLRATFAAIAEIENYLDKSLGEVLMGMSVGKTRMPELKAIITFGSVGAGKEIDSDKLEEDLVEAGITNVIQAVAPFLNQAFNGVPKASPEKKAK